MSTNHNNKQLDDMSSEDMALLLQTALEEAGVPPPSPVEEVAEPTAIDLIAAGLTTAEPTTAEPNVIGPTIDADATVPDVVKPKRQKRCGRPDCRKKIGICDFPCKCGLIFCARHRYGTDSEKRATEDGLCHFCTFDYKAEQRERLEREFKGNTKRDHRGSSYGGPSGGNMAY
jgi:hypothetical protein